MTKKNNLFLDQNKNIKADFGYVFRSSAIFYIPPKVKTTICISNYWKFKNNIKVILLMTIRNLQGKLISKQKLNFDNANVISISKFGVKEGSIEIEAFGNTNLRIPYAAIMAVYERNHSISMVHSYTRNHSLSELEEKNCIISAKESCWTIKPNFINKAVFHNGHVGLTEQKAKLILTNQAGRDKIYELKIPNLNPYQTYIFDVKKIAPNFKKFLKNKEGWATINFESKSSFTRLLITWEDSSKKEFQVTHSNFDYSKYITNKLFSKKGVQMTFPKFSNLLDELNLITYPKFEKGNYFFYLNNKKREPFNMGFFKKLNPNDSFVNFKKKNNILPTRIVTALTGNFKDQLVPFECSMGVDHEQAPKKRFSWALVSGKHSNLIFLNRNKVIESEISNILIFKIFCKNSLIVKTKKIQIKFDSDGRYSVNLKKIFPFYKEFLKNDYGYISLFSSDISIRLYTALYNNKKSITLEHAF